MLQDRYLSCGQRRLVITGLCWSMLQKFIEVKTSQCTKATERLPYRRGFAADYNVLDGGLMPFGLLLLFLSPIMAAKLRATR